MDLEQYIAIKKEITILQDKAKEFETKMFEEMKEKELKQSKTPFGTFTVAVRKSYKLDDEIKDKIDLLKAKIKSEETGAILDGKGQVVEKEYLMFRVNKE